MMMMMMMVMALMMIMMIMIMMMMKMVAKNYRDGANGKTKTHPEPGVTSERPNP